MKVLSGIVIPAVTPFDENENVSRDMMEHNFNDWNKTDISGYMCLGSNGEFCSLDDEESFLVLKTAIEIKDKKKFLIAGVGRESLYQTLKFIDTLQTKQFELDYISVLTPHYFKNLMSDRALIEYYKKIADFSQYPVLLYCAPDFANSVCISAQAVRELADHPNIFGIKDTSKDMMNTYMDAVGNRKDFSVMAGSLGNIMTCLERGGVGGVVSAANYFPQSCAKLMQIFREEGIESARKYHEELQRLVKSTGAIGGIAGVKCCMNLMGLKGGKPRRPILPVDPQIRAEMKLSLERGKVCHT